MGDCRSMQFAPISFFLGIDWSRRCGARCIIRRSLAGAVLVPRPNLCVPSMEPLRVIVRLSKLLMVSSTSSLRVREGRVHVSDDVLRGESERAYCRVLGSWDMTRTISRFMSGGARVRARCAVGSGHSRCSVT